MQFAATKTIRENALVPEENHEGKKKKSPLGFRVSPDVAKAIRAAAYRHRLTLDQFFESAALREIERLDKEPPAEKAPPDRLPRGRPIKVDDDGHD